MEQIVFFWIILTFALLIIIYTTSFNLSISISSVYKPMPMSEPYLTEVGLAITNEGPSYLGPGSKIIIDGQTYTLKQELAPGNTTYLVVTMKCYSICRINSVKIKPKIETSKTIAYIITHPYYLLGLNS